MKKTFAKFTGKQLRESPFLIDFKKETLTHWCFLCEFCEIFLRTTLSEKKQTIGWKKEKK